MGMNLFGKKQVVSTTDTINSLRTNIEMLVLREDRVKKKIDTCLQEAKTKALRKDKNV